MVVQIINIEPESIDIDSVNYETSQAIIAIEYIKVDNKYTQSEVGVLHLS